MSELSEAVDKARAIGHMKRGKCSMCAVGDKPQGGFHREILPCGNEKACLICIGVSPPNEQCQACGRINKREVMA